MSYIWSGLTSQNRSGTSSFYLYDSQGSVRNLVNAAGAITDTYVSTAFGVELLTGSGTVNPFRYVGLFGYYLEFVNLYYVRARWLDGLKGRWDSRDLIGFAGRQANLFAYVGNDPVALVDPTGLAAFVTKSCDTYGDVSKEVGTCCDNISRKLAGTTPDSPVYMGIAKCMSDKGFAGSEITKRIGEGIAWMLKACSKETKICIWCLTNISAPNDWPGSCNNNCKHILKSTGRAVAFTPLPATGNPETGMWPIDVEQTNCTPFHSPEDGCDKLRVAPDGTVCTAVVALCYAPGSKEHKWNCGTIYHELTHAGGLFGAEGHHGFPHKGMTDKRDDFVFALGCCLCLQASSSDAKSCDQQCSAWT